LMRFSDVLGRRKLGRFLLVEFTIIAVTALLLALNEAFFDVLDDWGSNYWLAAVSASVVLLWLVVLIYKRRIVI
jgi:hypothetical protein